MSSVDLNVIMVVLLYVGQKKTRDVAGVMVDWMVGSDGLCGALRPIPNKVLIFARYRLSDMSEPAGPREKGGHVMGAEMAQLGVVRVDAVWVSGMWFADVLAISGIRRGCGSFMLFVK